MNRKALKLLIVPLVITVIYFVAQALLLVNHLGVFSVVEQVTLDFKKTNQQDVHLLEDQKASATFKASENNLGIILVRLVKFGGGEDRVVFRIKKEGEEKWYHESKVFGGQVQNDQYFPLGFPPIPNSKNNTYVFELESLTGEYDSGIGLIKDKPAAVMYKYSVGDLKNYRTLLSFTYKKSFYTLKNINYLQVIAVFVISSLLFIFMKKKKLTAPTAVGFLLNFKTNLKKAIKTAINKMKSNYLSFEKRMVNFSKKANRWFTSTKFYLLFLNTNTKKRVTIGSLIFLLAFTYRFSAILVAQEGVSLFYSGLGGQGDYDQFIRTATCALNFCSAILGQNFLIEASVLGVFYKIVGFIGGLKAYLYLMLILSSIVATLPYFLLSRKNWITIGGIIGGLFLATSDFLTQVALNFPPDNGSLFTFSMFFIVYFLTLQRATIRWLLFFGLVGTIDGLNKALFLINDLAAFALFVPVFFFEKAKRINKFPFVRLNSKLVLYSVLPLLIFLTIYSAWEYLVYIKFSAYYFLRGLVESRGISYVSYTSFNDGSSAGNIISQLLYLCVSAIVMVKRLVEYSGLNMFFLAPIFLGLLFFTFAKRKVPLKKFTLTVILSALVIFLLVLIRDNYFNIHQIFPGEYIKDNWKTETYIGIFLFVQILTFFILNFKYSAIKLALPIIPYVLMLIILTKNSPFARLNTHVVAWSVILLAYILDYLFSNFNKYTFLKNKGSILGSLSLLIFILFYFYPKMGFMSTNLSSGLSYYQSEIRYMNWVNSELPKNAIILGGNKEDLITLGDNVNKPIVYNSFFGAAMIIPENRDYSYVKEFGIVKQLKSKDSFKKNKYTILEENINVWRDRLAKEGDAIFSTRSANLLNPNNYSIKVYKFNQTLKKGIYELGLE